MPCRFALIALALALAGCSERPEPAPPAASTVAPAHGDAGVAWHKDDVDSAFAVARTDRKPVFLYWGALWCPPCNQVKATIFNRQDFIERSRHFIPVYIDGDSPGAQRLGARFKVSGYPTMILFQPDGSEITRLPGEVDADQYMRVLTMGMNGARPVKDTLAAALAGPSATNKTGPGPDDWRMLAYYSWITDDAQLVPKADVATTLARLADACPADQRETAVRLKLQALAAAATAERAQSADDRAAAGFLLQVTADPMLARANFDLVTSYAAKIAGHVTLPRSAERSELVKAWNAALDRLVPDASLSTADRLTALAAKVDLAKQDAGGDALPQALQQAVRAQVAAADRATTDAYARQAVIATAADLLAEAGMLDASDAMLTAELQRSHSPYYYMLGLAANARKRGDNAKALDWHDAAYTAAVGSATRLQWGASYLDALIDLTPDDSERILSAALHVIGELDTSADTFHDRNRRTLERIGRKLAAWNKGGKHAEALRRVHARMAVVCADILSGAPERAVCESVLRPTKAATA